MHNTAQNLFTDTLNTRWLLPQRISELRAMTVTKLTSSTKSRYCPSPEIGQWLVRWRRVMSWPGPAQVRGSQTGLGRAEPASRRVRRRRPRTEPVPEPVPVLVLPPCYPPHRTRRRGTEQSREAGLASYAGILCWHLQAGAWRGVA